MGAFDGDGGEAADGFQSFAREITAGKADGADAANAHTQRHEADAAIAVEDGFASAADGLQLVGGKLRLAGRIEEVSFLPFLEKHGGAGDPETIDYVVGDAVDEAEDVVADQELLAESVEALDFAAALVRLCGFAPGAGGELAGDDGGAKKGEQGDPVLRVGDRKLIERWKEKIVVSDGGEYGGEDGAVQAPDRGDDENGQQKSETDGGLIYVQPTGIDEDNKRHRGG